MTSLLKEKPVAGEERREHPRIPVSISVVIYHEQEPIVARSKNLSLGGMAIVLDRRIEEGARVEVSFHLVLDGKVDLTTPRIRLEGTIIWAIPTAEGACDHGIRFSKLRAEDLTTLQTFIGRLS
jgi:c-di-GMP-binding flagellar brake protein YcgR